MKLPAIDLTKLQDDNGYYSEKQKDALETLYGKPLKELEEMANEQADVPEGNPKDWSRDTKLQFIKEHSRDEYQRLIDERK